MDSTFFHVTPAVNLPSILANGLIPAIGPRSQEYGETQERTYFFAYPDMVHDALTNWLGDALEDVGDMVIVAVDLSDMHVAWDVPFEGNVDKPVPAPRILQVLDEEMKPIRDVAAFAEQCRSSESVGPAPARSSPCQTA